MGKSFFLQRLAEYHRLVVLMFCVVFTFNSMAEERDPFQPFYYDQIVVIDNCIYFVSTEGDNAGEGFLYAVILDTGRAKTRSIYFMPTAVQQYTAEMILKSPEELEKNIGKSSKQNSGDDAAELFPTTGRHTSAFYPWGWVVRTRASEQETLNNGIAKTRGEGGGSFIIKVIGQGAFGNVSDLTEVVIPESVEQIWGLAFNNCKNLAKVTIPESVKAIGADAFAGCTSLKSITIPNSVSYWESGVFRKCSSLESVSLSNSLPDIPTGLFRECTSLKSIDIPSSVRSINAFAFLDCPKLSTITGGKNVQRIGLSAFQNCENLKDFPFYSSLKGIDKYAFDGCNFSDVDLSACTSLDSIREGAFSNCYNMKNVRLPEGLKVIESIAFAYSDNLKSITIPSTVKKINLMAFSDTNADEKKPYEVNISDLNSFMNIQVDRDNSWDIPIPFGYYSLKLNGVEVKDVRFPETTKSISPIFQNCMSLTSVTIPKSAQIIDNYAFSNCINLKQVYSFIENPFRINDMAFGTWINNKNIYSSATLYVPEGTSSAYGSMSAWNKFEVLKEFDTTSIDAVNVEEIEPKVYNLKGHLMKNPHKGMYIKNGKKIFIK